MCDFCFSGFGIVSVVCIWRSFNVSNVELKWLSHLQFTGSIADRWRTADSFPALQAGNLTSTHGPAALLQQLYATGLPLDTTKPTVPGRLKPNFQQPVTQRNATQRYASVRIVSQRNASSTSRSTQRNATHRNVPQRTVPYRTNASVNGKKYATLLRRSDAVPKYVHKTRSCSSVI